MEPSTARTADGTPIAIRNFCASVGDFALHYSARNFLCEEGLTYFITNVAKGAVPTGQAKKTASKRWPKWYPLLKKELALVSKPEVPVIAVGSRVETFLGEQGTPRLKGSILHYSPNASVGRMIAPQLFPQQYAEFLKAVSVADLVRDAKDLMKDAMFDECREGILQNLRKAGGTPSNKRLMFTYKTLFNAMFERPEF